MGFMEEIRPYPMTYFYSKTNEMRQFLYFFFLTSTLHVGGLVEECLMSLWSRRLNLLSSFFSARFVFSTFDQFDLRPDVQNLLFLSRGVPVDIKFVTKATLIQTCMCACIYIYSLLWRCGPTRAMASSFLRFRDHTRRLITVGRTPLDEW